MKSESLKILDLIGQAIFDKKGSNILVLDVKGISTMTDYFVIAEGNVDRHVKAICQSIRDAMKAQGYQAIHVEGESDADWIVIDFGEFVIHLFVPELREKYALEELWREGKIVDLHITTGKEGIK